MRELLAVKGVEKTSNAFRRRLILMADARALDPDYVAAVISVETAATFSPSIRNKFSGAVGLIQFLPSTARTLGTTAEALAKMTAEDQLAWVGKYYERVQGAVKHPLITAGDHYLAAFSGGPGIGKDEGHVLYTQGSKAYEQNFYLDTSQDGTITVGEAIAPVRAVVKAAEQRAPIVVDMGEPAKRYGAAAAVAAALAAAAAAVEALRRFW